MADFFIKSIELRNYNQKHGCTVLDVVDSTKLLVELEPPIPGFVYNQTDDLDLVVLAPRYEGTTLTPAVSEWPCIVNICLPKTMDGWHSGPWRLLDVGEITPD